MCLMAWMAEELPQILSDEIRYWFNLYEYYMAVPHLWGLIISHRGIRLRDSRFER